MSIHPISLSTCFFIYKFKHIYTCTRAIRTNYIHNPQICIFIRKSTYKLVPNLISSKYFNAQQSYNFSLSTSFYQILFSRCQRRIGRTVIHEYDANCCCTNLASLLFASLFHSRFTHSRTIFVLTKPFYVAIMSPSPSHNCPSSYPS